MFMNKFFLSGLLLFLAPAMVLAADFSDVPEDYKYHTAIRWLQAEGIVQGYEDGTFRPENTVSRAELLKVIAHPLIQNLINTNPYFQPHDAAYYNNVGLVAADPEKAAELCSGEDSPSKCEYDYDWYVECMYGEARFSDTEPGAWYQPYVCEMRRHKYISGYSDGTFHPGQTVNFAEAAKMISRRFDSWIGVHSITELPEPEGERWFFRYIVALYENGAVPSDITSPEHLVTRGEMAEILYQLSKDTINYNYDLINFYDYKAKIPDKFPIRNDNYMHILQTHINREKALKEAVEREAWVLNTNYTTKLIKNYFVVVKGPYGSPEAAGEIPQGTYVKNAGELIWPEKSKHDPLMYPPGLLQAFAGDAGEEDVEAGEIEIKWQYVQRNMCDAFAPGYMFYLFKDGNQVKRISGKAEKSIEMYVKEHTPLQITGLSPVMFIVSDYKNDKGATGTIDRKEPCLAE